MQRAHQKKTRQEAEAGFSALGLREIWDRLTNCPRLGDVAEIHRGIEWQSPLDPEKYLSPTKKPGFKRGLVNAAGFQCFETPLSVYLCTKPESLWGNAFDLPWERPKVVTNAGMVSRGSWKLVAFADETGLICTQKFHSLWPRDSHWTVKSLAAVLNAPVACAFIADHDGKLRVRKTALNKIPLPRLGVAELETLDRLVDSYLRVVARLPRAGSREESTSHTSSAVVEEAKQPLLQIDALVLKGYNLPPRLERQLLDFFRGSQRPVPFPFSEYFPESFTPTIPLWMYISPEYKKSSVDYFLKNAPRITDPRLIEALQEAE